MSSPRQTSAADAREPDGQHDADRRPTPPEPTMFLGRMAPPIAWQAEDVCDADWRVSLPQEVLESLEQEGRSALAAGVSAAAVAADGDIAWSQRYSSKIPAPLRAFAGDLSRMLTAGYGFAVVDRLPVENYTDDVAYLVYWALARSLGTCVTQNGRGEYVCEVKDYQRGKIVANRATRGYQTAEALPFHTDSADIVGLLCLADAVSGGESALASSMHVHNEIVENHREYLGLLYSGVFYDSRGDEQRGALPVYNNPIFGYFGGKVFCRYYLRQFAEAAANHGFALTVQQREALNIFEDIATRPESRILMTLRRGEIQFVNDNVVLHARTPYADDSQHLRRLLRIWLNLHGSAPLPNGFAYARDGFAKRDPGR